MATCARRRANICSSLIANVSDLVQVAEHFCEFRLSSGSHRTRGVTQHKGSRRICAGSCDRNFRHNAARNSTGEFASRAAQNPELEKPDLLPPKPGVPGSNRRRPADVYLPWWAQGRPAALDIAVNCSRRVRAPQEEPLGHRAPVQREWLLFRPHGG